MLGALIRGAAYATLFIGVVLVYLPARTLAWAGVARPDRIGVPQIAGIITTAAGAALAIWCILSFAVIGRGTPLPLDPPRHLVVRGPYRYVRNPMYLGAGLALAGAAIYYQTLALAAFAAAFLAVMHLAVVLSEEPILRDTFGEEYDAYCQHVRRWWPAVR